MSTVIRDGSPKKAPLPRAWELARERGQAARLDPGALNPYKPMSYCAIEWENARSGRTPPQPGSRQNVA